MKIFDTSTLDPATDDLSADDVYWIYNGLDCCLTSEIRETLSAQMDDVSRATYEQEMRMTAPILSMMLRGLKVSTAHRRELSAKADANVKILERNFNRLCIEGVGLTEPLNWRSHTQVKHLLYQVLKLPVTRKRNAKGILIEDSSRVTLEKLSAHHIAKPFISHLLALRDAGKRLGFLKTPLDKDGRMRCNFNIAGTNTGRLSSSFSDYGTGTNLQNVTAELRYAFIPDPGKVFINIDLEQADSRNVGALCYNLFYESHGPEFAGSYLDACESGDLHTLVCRMAWPDLEWEEGNYRATADLKAYREKSYRDLAKMLGHGCLTAEHEVLTPSGWVAIAEQPDTILQWEEGKSSWAAPSHWEAHTYTGVLHSFEGTSMSALMTHDHRVPYKKDNYSPVVHELPAAAGPQKIMPLGNGFTGGKVSTWGKLIAAVMSDGELIGNKTRFNFHKQRKINRLCRLCDEVSVPYTQHSDGRISIAFSHPKKAGAYMLQWDSKTALDFLSEYAYWDGHHAPTATTLFSIDREHLQWIQTLGRVYGLGGNIQKPQLSGFGSVTYRLQQNKRKYATGKSVTWTKHPTVDTMVYCPTVPTGWFYVRRNGKIFVTGNTNYLGQAPTMSGHSKVPVDQIREFQKNYFAAFPCIPAWHAATINTLETTGQLTNLFGRRRFFFNRLNEDKTHNAAIAYSPQGSTGDEINEGILRLSRDPRFELLVQVHDSILFQVDWHLLDELMPIALEALEVKIPLAGGREFFVPVDAMVGWNWGYAGKSNPFGLAGWKGKELRKPPRTHAERLILSF